MSIDAPPSAVEETGQGGGLPTPVRRRTEGVGEEDMGRSRAVLRPSRRSETQGEQLLLSRQRERQALRRLRLQNSHLAQKEVETQSHGRRERERAREMESEREREGMQSKELVRQGEEDSVRDWQRIPAFHPRPLPQPQPERRSELTSPSVTQYLMTLLNAQQQICSSPIPTQGHPITTKPLPTPISRCPVLCPTITSCQL